MDQIRITLTGSSARPCTPAPAVRFFLSGPLSGVSRVDGGVAGFVIACFLCRVRAGPGFRQRPRCRKP